MELPPAADDDVEARCLNTLYTPPAAPRPLVDAPASPPPAPPAGAREASEKKDSPMRRTSSSLGSPRFSCEATPRQKMY